MFAALQAFQITFYADWFGYEDVDLDDWS